MAWRTSSSSQSAPRSAREGGTQLLKAALEWASGPLTLTTYAHVPWNAPWYERMGFKRLREEELSLGLRTRMSEERAVLPAPEQRVAMRRK